MAVYARQVATATRLIKAKGEVVTWLIASAPTVADPAKPWIKQDSAPVEKTVSIVWVSGTSNPFIALANGSEVEEGSAFGLMHVVDFTPDLKDQIRLSNNEKLELLALDPVAPNSEVILWKLKAKR